MISHTTYLVLITINFHSVKISTKKNSGILPYYRFKNKTCANISPESHSDD